MEEKKKELYGRLDFVGWLLSEWRTRAVLPYVVGDLMDLACGDNRLVRKNGSGVGVDIVDYQNVDIVCPDFSNLPFAENTFDTVTILAALNYFDNPVKVLSEIARILKPDGTLLVTFLNQSVSRAWHTIKERDTTPRPAFNKEELAACLQTAGMHIVDRKSFMLGVNIIYFIKR
ncbi:MAG: class I SAM-dependent methyltransferase [Desulfobulbaceae bacterium]|nr:class I SAM-dependent methyltransferase [Desulfobulbaceae bacterium]